MTVSKFTKSVSDKAVQDKINEIIDNLGGGITVDQTYNGTSANAQSGVAIAGAGFLKKAVDQKYYTNGDLVVSNGNLYVDKINLGDYSYLWEVTNSDNLKDLTIVANGGKIKFTSPETPQYIINNVTKTPVFTSDLSTVATSGSYNDLSNTPTIPTVNNATLTITQGGTTKGTFTANASSDVTIDIDAGGGIIVDSAISSTSTNPVQNKVVKSALDKKLSLEGGVLEDLDNGYRMSLYPEEFYMENDNGKEISIEESNGFRCYTPDDSEARLNSSELSVFWWDNDNDRQVDFTVNNSGLSFDLDDKRISWNRSDNTTLHIPTSSSTYANASNDTAVSVKWLKDNAMPLKQDVSNLVTSISSSSTDTQYPSAKCVYDELADKADTSSLSTVATTGDYDDLTNKPTIPTYPFNGITFYSTDGTTSSITRDCNQILNNGLFYYNSNGPSGLGEQSTDGALYVQAYSTSWVVQIAQDYRTGNLFTRSKNNGTWTAWKAVGGSAITIDYSGV